MRKRNLQSTFSNVTTGGVTELCGPSERRVALIVSPPGSGVMGLSPTGKGSVASFALFGTVQPLVISYEVWGSIVRGGWELNDFGTSRSIAWVEVIEEWEELPAAVAEEKPEQSQEDRGKEQEADRVAPLTRRTRRTYLKRGLLG